jgi:hypothetical protein
MCEDSGERLPGLGLDPQELITEREQSLARFREDTRILFPEKIVGMTDEQVDAYNDEILERLREHPRTEEERREGWVRIEAQLGNRAVEGSPNNPSGRQIIITGQ